MTVIDELDQLADILEKFIFSKEELKEIGKIITQLQNGTCSPEQLKTKILESRVRILKDITEFSKFYISHILSTDTKTIPNQQVLDELEQKNLLLLSIAKKLEHMTFKTQTEP
jgi:predicted DNA-binding ArsR family transcriptional regulator